MVTTNEIIDVQSYQIGELQNEIVLLRSSQDDYYYEQIILNLKEELFVMHGRMDKLNEEKEELIEQYNTVVNSKTWKYTQFLRNILWKLKGKE